MEKTTSQRNVPDLFFNALQSVNTDMELSYYVKNASSTVKFEGWSKDEIDKIKHERSTVMEINW